MWDVEGCKGRESKRAGGWKGNGVERGCFAVVGLLFFFWWRWPDRLFIKI